MHLGFSGCSAGYLLDFLRSTTCDYLYLVGDIIDIWQPQSHNDVIRTILGAGSGFTCAFSVILRKCI